VREPRAHPADGAPALVPLDGGGDARDHGALLVLGHVLLALGVRHAVTDDLVAALSQPLGDVGGGLVDLDVHLRLDRQVELVEEVEEPPDPDAVAVVTPGIDAGTHRLVGRRDGDALAHAEAERLDVDRDVHGEARAVRPRVVRPLRDVGVVVASVGGQRHTASYGRRGLSRISSYGYANAWPVIMPSADCSTRGPTPDRTARSSGRSFARMPTARRSLMTASPVAAYTASVVRSPASKPRGYPASASSCRARAGSWGYGGAGQ